MSRIERFEDLIAWQKARLLVKAIYQITRHGLLAKDYGLASQMQRAAVSITSNIAEGAERTGLGELHHCLTVAKASCAELRSQLYNAYDAGYLDDDLFTCLLNQAAEVGRVIGGLRASLEKTRSQQ